MAYEGLMVSVSGVRGRVGEALTPEVVATFAAGFGAWAAGRHPNRTIVVGRDSRVSGPMFHRVVLAALQSVGCDVVDLGMVPTPTVQLAVEHHHAAGGLAITASHNPVEWNALKFIASTGLFLDGTEAADMRRTVESGFPRATWDRLGTISQDAASCERHVEAILALPYLDVAGIRKRGFSVALDACHGAGVANGKGMGYKVGDHLTVNGCSECNHYTDAYGGATAAAVCSLGPRVWSRLWAPERPASSCTSRLAG